MSKTTYGRLYWGCKVIPEVADDGEIYTHADRVEVGPAGELRFIRDAAELEGKARPELVTLVIPAGRWLAVFAASVFDGHPVAVEHWSELGIGGGIS